MHAKCSFSAFSIQWRSQYASGWSHHSHKWNSTKCRGSARTFTWCQARWDLLSGSARRSKSSCRCLLGDRQWWHGSTGHTGDACRLCNVCRERSQICGTDKDERDQQEWMTEGGGRKKRVFTLMLHLHRTMRLIYSLDSRSWLWLTCSNIAPSRIHPFSVHFNEVSEKHLRLIFFTPCAHTGCFGIITKCNYRADQFTL